MTLRAVNPRLVYPGWLNNTWQPLHLDGTPEHLHAAVDQLRRDTCTQRERLVGEPDPVGCQPGRPCTRHRKRQRAVAS